MQNWRHPIIDCIDPSITSPSMQKYKWNRFWYAFSYSEICIFAFCVHIIYTYVCIILIRSDFVGYIQINIKKCVASITRSARIRNINRVKTGSISGFPSNLGSPLFNLGFVFSEWEIPIDWMCIRFFGWPRLRFVSASLRLRSASASQKNGYTSNQWEFPTLKIRIRGWIEVDPKLEGNPEIDPVSIGIFV